MKFSPDTVQVGDELPTLKLPAVDRTVLALFGGASGDHNPVHIDIDFARRAGMPDVFAQGMLGMAWRGWVGSSPNGRHRQSFAASTRVSRASHTWEMSSAALAGWWRS